MALTKKKDISDITAGEFKSLSEFVCGLNAAEISRVKDVTFRYASDTVNDK